jgi:hypothetical protein
VDIGWRLAVTTAPQWEGVPNVPTVDDFVPGFEANAVGGRGTLPAIITKLNIEINAGLADS